MKVDKDDIYNKTGGCGAFIQSVFPSYINKDGRAFKAILADGEGNGAIESTFDAVELERKNWHATDDIYELESEELTRAVNTMSVIERELNDSDETVKKFFELLFYRAGEGVWGTLFNMLHVFRTYFASNRIYVVNNSGNVKEDNLIPNYNLEDDTLGKAEDDVAPQYWDCKNCYWIKDKYRFEGKRSLGFHAGGMLSQSVTLEAGVYFLHFFCKDKVRVKIASPKGFWRVADIGASYPDDYPKDKMPPMPLPPYIDAFGQCLSGKWQEGECEVEFIGDNPQYYKDPEGGQLEQCAPWEDKSVCFTLPAADTVTITFTGEEGAGVDYVRLYPKKGESSFSLISVFGMVTTTETAHYAPNGPDALTVTNYGEGIPSPEKEKLISLGKIGDLVIDYQHQISYMAAENPNKKPRWVGAYILGGQGTMAVNTYTMMLDILRPAGVWAYSELLEGFVDTNVN